MEHSSEKELERIARLAGLSLSEEEKDILFADLSRIVPYMERISELDTAVDTEQDGTEDEPKVFREDEDRVSDLSAKILEQAPSARNGLFTVPKTIE